LKGLRKGLERTRKIFRKGLERGLERVRKRFRKV